MKIVFLEPLGIPNETLKQMAVEVVGDRAEIVCYDNRVEDAETLIERSKDADCVVLSNFQYRRNVMEHCPNLKMVCVAFTGVDHVDLEYCREKALRCVTVRVIPRLRWQIWYLDSSLIWPEM